MWGNGYTMMGWGWLAGAVVVILIVVAVIVVVRMLPGRTNPSVPREQNGSLPAITLAKTPRQILDERYAHGDLTTEEYRERIENLGSA